MFRPRVVLPILVLLSTFAIGQSVNAVPYLNQPLIPTSVPPGSPPFTLNVRGTGFVPGSLLEWNGLPLETTFVNPRRILAKVPAGNVAVRGTVQITVTTPGPGGGMSNPALFSVTDPTPVLKFTSSTLPVGIRPESTLAADFNGDGKADLAVFNFCGADPDCAANGSVSILLGDGNGSFSNQPDLVPIGHPVSGVLGDFDGDGFWDLAVISQPNCMGCAEVTVFSGNGDGTFRTTYKTPGLDGIYLSIAAGDFNHDGHLDLAVPALTGFGMPLVYVWLGNGDGSFSPAPAIQAPLVYSPSSLAVGDFNRDGVLDLALTDDDNFSGNPLAKILLGNGDGTFRLAPHQPSTTLTSPQYVTAGDFNNDGTLDLAYVDAGLAPLVVLLGSGFGTFTQNMIEPKTTSPGFLATADFNADGKLDLLMGNSIYLNRVDGIFKRGHTIGDPLSAPAAIGDFNGDGRLDLAIANSTDNTASIVLQSEHPPRGPSKCKIGSSSSSFYKGQRIRFTASVDGGPDGVPTGRVAFLDSAYSQFILGTANLVEGKASITAGLHPDPSRQYVQAVYLGDNSFFGCESDFLPEFAQ